ncbi:hypothetical protein P154DRAFT_448920 [Amniculicola lignicola CBS 123094]|uniref:Rhodopsin domain-containing protein n=1 Tax=Amniculicola lignicola CBS 123094 TaxID=1392246 RepID=A0A6A5VY57_9PLEO|nr:hypothetical protein P154DRAFT_448920 [Amniculicola lignicola CBS 123094]
MYAGYYAKDIPVQNIDFVYATKLRYALAVEYNPVICFIKASLMWSLQRLRPGNIWIRRSLYFMQCLNLAYAIGAFVASALPCIPVSYQWNTNQKGSCYDPYAFVIGNVSVVIVTDFLVLLIPTWIIYDLQMALRKKIITICFLSLGIVVILIGIFRLIWLTKAFSGKSNNHSVESAYSAIESNIAIIGASGPTVKYILSFPIPWLRPESWDSTKGPSAYAKQYGTNSSKPNTRRRNTYNDLDSHSLEREEYEMKNDWQWKKDADANSDEQVIMENHDTGITKTVNWTISTRDDGSHVVPPPASEQGPSYGAHTSKHSNVV